MAKLKTIFLYFLIATLLICSMTIGVLAEKNISQLILYFAATYGLISLKKNLIIVMPQIKIIKLTINVKTVITLTLSD